MLARNYQAPKEGYTLESATEFGMDVTDTALPEKTIGAMVQCDYPAAKLERAYQLIGLVVNQMVSSAPRVPLQSACNTGFHTLLVGRVVLAARPAH